MKKIIILIIVLTLLFSYKKETISPIPSKLTPLYNTINSFHSVDESDLRIMTYNLLSHELGFDGTQSDERKSDIIALINAIKPHILCLQETSFDYYQSLTENTELKFISPVSYFLSRSMTVLMYNPTFLTPIDYGSIAYKYSTNPRLRNYTWGLFQEKQTENIILIVNTHLNLYKQATAYPLLQAIELIEFCRKKEQEYNCPVYITGDFNSQENSEKTGDCAVYDYISLFYNDTKEKAESKTYGTGKNLYSPISDYIFCTDDSAIKSYTLLSQPELNVLSDHFPVFIDINIS